MGVVFRNRKLFLKEKTLCSHSREGLGVPSDSNKADGVART